MLHFPINLIALATMLHTQAPSYLYKVLSVEQWHASESAQTLDLPPADRDFIHFSREDQLGHLLAKKTWAELPAYVLLKIDTSKLPGTMVFESNASGTDKYYHLYGGSIPLNAIVESTVIEKAPQE